MVTVEIVNQIPELREKGLTTKEISEKLGINIYVVRYWEKRLRQANRTVKTRIGRPPLKL